MKQAMMVMLVPKQKRRNECHAVHVKERQQMIQQQFFSVPCTEQKEYPTNASNAVRKSYYRRVHRRKVFLSRLGLSQNDKRKGLKICDHHELEVTPITYEWRDDTGIMVKATDEMQIPVNPVDPPNRTRSQTTIRKPPKFKNNRKHKRKITTTMSIVSEEKNN
jgi:hypothetical protein